MKTLFTILILIILLSACTFAQPQQPDTLWTRTFGGSSSDYGYSVQQTLDGGFIVTGSTRSYSALNRDVYLIKTDPFGNQQWYRTFGGNHGDESYSVQQTMDNGFIILGQSNSFSIDGYDVYLIKTDSLGNQLWSQTFSINEHDYARHAQQTLDGGYIIVGYTGDYGPGYFDAFLIKTDSLGNQQWRRIYDENLDEVGFCVQQTLEGGYIITGYIGYSGTLTSDVYLIKTDSSGNQLWSQTFGGNFNDIGRCVQQTNEEGYIITGMQCFYGTNYDDVYLIKTDSVGCQLQTKSEPLL